LIQFFNKRSDFYRRPVSKDGILYYYSGHTNWAIDSLFKTKELLKQKSFFNLTTGLQPTASSAVVLGCRVVQIKFAKNRQFNEAAAELTVMQKETNLMIH